MKKNQTCCSYERQQRIVLPIRFDFLKDGDVRALLSALAWISSQSVSHNNLPHHQLEEKALTEKILVTCSVISYFSHYILSKQGIKSRVIGTHTLDDWNGYDDGHMMLEVFMPDLKEWVLYDIGSKHYFTVNGLATNALGLYHAAKTGDFEMVPISNTTIVDIVGFEDHPLLQ